VKVAILQPTYLPWLGYFDLTDQVDTVVLLDTVQFERQSWQQRNRIKGPSGLQWLSVPVVFRGRLHQKIKDVQIREAEFGKRHLRAVEVNYRRAPFFDVYFPQLSAILQAFPAGTRLADLNLRLLEWLAAVLDVHTPLVLASSLELEGNRTKLLANICVTLGARQYVSPIGSAIYLLEELELLTDCGLDVVFQNYKHPEYHQLFPPFVEYSSTLDLIFNEGGRSMEIIRSGRGLPLSPEQVTSRLAQAKEA
jgi:hypothetical protein